MSSGTILAVKVQHTSYSQMTFVMSAISLKCEVPPPQSFSLSPSHHRSKWHTYGSSSPCVGEMEVDGQSSIIATSKMRSGWKEWAWGEGHRKHGRGECCACCPLQTRISPREFRFQHPVEVGHMLSVSLAFLSRSHGCLISCLIMMCKTRS